MTFKKEYLKKSAAELQDYLLLFKRRSSIIKNKKGKGSYSRKNQKFDF